MTTWCFHVYTTVSRQECHVMTYLSQHFIVNKTIELVYEDASEYTILKWKKQNFLGRALLDSRAFGARPPPCWFFWKIEHCVQALGVWLHVIACHNCWTCDIWSFHVPLVYLKYSVSQKNIPNIFSYNSRKHCRILIIFGSRITEKVGNQ